MIIIIINTINILINNNNKMCPESESTTYSDVSIIIILLGEQVANLAIHQDSKKAECEIM